MLFKKPIRRESYAKNEFRKACQLFLERAKRQKSFAGDHAKSPYKRSAYTLAYADQEALSQTLKSGIATFWSTSRNELWIKGLTSGNTFRVVEMLADCENNSLIYRVIPLEGGACHCVDEAGEKCFSCFRRKLKKGGRR